MGAYSTRSRSLSPLFFRVLGSGHGSVSASTSSTCHAHNSVSHSEQQTASKIESKTLQYTDVQYQPVHTEIACEHTLLAASLKPLPSQTAAFR